MQRNVLRHLTWSIPSGQVIGRARRAPLLASGALEDLRDISPALVTSTPLFFYILREADLVEDGARLGPVGGHIVAEVFLGLLQLDPLSFLNVQPDWVPTLPAQGGSPESFRVADLLIAAGVDPASRKQ